MSRKTEIIVGFFIIITSLWATSFLLGTIPETHWSRFPLLVTSMSAWFGGWFLVMPWPGPRA